MQRLFVYGTLAPGQANHKLLESVAGSWEPATLKGNLINEGWGADMGCPGIVPATDGNNVEGFVFSSIDLANQWTMLDDFEGEGYKRVFVKVRVNGTHDVEAFVYALKHEK